MASKRFYNKPDPEYVEPSREELERCFQAGRRAIREYEQSKNIQDPYQPNWARDRFKGAQGD